MQYSKPLLTLSSSRLEGSKNNNPKKILILTPNKKEIGLQIFLNQYLSLTRMEKTNNL